MLTFFMQGGDAGSSWLSGGWCTGSSGCVVGVSDILSSVGSSSCVSRVVSMLGLCVGVLAFVDVGLFARELVRCGISLQ
jgi:hypothetical protein